MSKVLLLWLLTYVGGLVLSLVHPIYPFMSYLAFYYMPPEKNWWGVGVPNLRWSLLASAAMLGSVLLKNTSLERLKETRNPALPWFLLFGANVILVTLWAVNRFRSWNWSLYLLKLILLYALIPAVVRTPAQFDMFAAAHIGGATYWGYKAWDDPKREAGRLKDVGGTDTQNENAAAAHLLTVLPFVAVYFFSVKRRTLKGVILICGGFIVNVLVLCNSRGSTVGLLVMGCAAVALAGRGKRLKLLGVAAAAFLVLLSLADNRFLERQQTTVEHQDGSSQGRIESWQAGLRFMLDYPLGAGGRGFHILSWKYIPDIVEAHGGEERSLHSTYLQVGTEWGILGLVTWSGFVIATMLLLERARRSSVGDTWYYYRFLALQLALVGTLVSGIFTSRLYGESVYWMCALAFALHRIHETSRSAGGAEGIASPTPLPAVQSAGTADVRVYEA